MSEGMSVTVNAADFPGTPDDLMVRAVQTVLRGEGHAAGEISVTLLDDDGIRALNKQYLGKDAPTDVIAFSLGEGETVLGDVYLGAAVARRQAEALEIALPEELARLAIHGVLHVLGHDHPDGPERSESPMFALQERYLAATLAGDGEGDA